MIILKINNKQATLRTSSNNQIKEDLRLWNKTKGMSMDKTALVPVKKINMGGSQSTCRYSSQGNHISP